MPTGVEHGLVLLTRVATGSVLFSIIGLAAYVVGGYIFAVDTVELAYPFLDTKLDPVLNFLLSLVGVGFFVVSLPLLLLEVHFGQNEMDYSQVVLIIVMGSIGLALVRLPVVNIL